MQIASDIDEKTSTSGYLMSMGSTKVYWSCKNKGIVENSSS